MGEMIKNQEQLKETKHHGAVRFPFTIYPCTMPNGDFLQVPLHWHDTMELVFVKKGCGIIQVGVNTFRANAGEIYIFVPGTLHGIRPFSREVMEYENIIFDLELLGGADDICAERYFLPLQSGRLALPTHICPTDEGYSLAVHCLHEAEETNRTQPIGYELAIKGALLRFLSILLGLHCEVSPIETADTHRLKTILQFIGEESSHAISIQTATAVCGCSQSHFMRWFKKMTGQSFTAYRNDHRLQLAAELLRTTDDTILDIACRVGFENLSYFNRLFKRRYGMTPREYRSKE